MARALNEATSARVAKVTRCASLKRAASTMLSRVVALRMSAASYAGGRCGRSSCTLRTSMPSSLISIRRSAWMARAMAALREKKVCAR